MSRTNFILPKTVDGYWTETALSASISSGANIENVSPFSDVHGLPGQPSWQRNVCCIGGWSFVLLTEVEDPILEVMLRKGQSSAVVVLSGALHTHIQKGIQEEYTNGQ